MTELFVKSFLYNIEKISGIGSRIAKSIIRNPDIQKSLEKSTKDMVSNALESVNSPMGEQKVRELTSRIADEFVKKIDPQRIGKNIGRGFVKSTIPPVAALTIGTVTFNKLINRNLNGKKR